MVFNPQAPPEANLAMAGCPSFVPLGDGSLATATHRAICQACGSVIPRPGPPTEHWPDGVPVDVSCPRTFAALMERAAAAAEGRRAREDEARRRSMGIQVVRV